MSLGIPMGQPSDFDMTEEQYWRIRNIFDAQSITFMCETMPILYGLYPTGAHNLTLLDVGARTGAGTGMIGYLHQRYAFNRLKIEATALDIDSQYLAYAKAHYGHARYVVADISNTDFNSSYDIVLASHTIEHVPDPDEFVGHLRRLAKQHVVIACPYEENDLIAGHVNRIDGAFFDKHDARLVHIYDSVAWTHSKACIAVLPPSA